MKKVRLGNDINIVWSVTGAQWVSAEALSASLYDRNDRQVPFDATITIDETTGGGTITGTFYGKDQKFTGTYRLLLQMNKGKADMLTLDHIEVFQLVDVCSFGIVEGLDSDNLTTATVEVSDIVSTIVGNTDLSSFVTRAEFEAGMATKQDELHYLTEDTVEGSASLSSGGARIDVVSTDDGGTTNIEAANVEIHDLSENNGIAVSGDGVAVTTGEGNKFTYNGVEVATVNNNSYTKNEVDTLLLGKMDDIDIDSSPSSGSLHLVYSGGIHSALQGKQATLVVGTNLDNTPVPSSTNPITSGGVYSAVSAVSEALTIVSVASGTSSITAEVGNYYKVAGDVSSLTITLPTITGATSVKGCVFMFTTASTTSVSVTSASTVYYFDGYSIDASKTYELNCIWNGSQWVVAYSVIATS